MKIKHMKFECIGIININVYGKWSLPTKII